MFLLQCCAATTTNSIDGDLIHLDSGGDGRPAPTPSRGDLVSLLAVLLIHLPLLLLLLLVTPDECVRRQPPHELVPLLQQVPDHLVLDLQQAGQARVGLGQLLARGRLADNCRCPVISLGRFGGGDLPPTAAAGRSLGPRGIDQRVVWNGGVVRRRVALVVLLLLLLGGG